MRAVRKFPATRGSSGEVAFQPQGDLPVPADRHEMDTVERAAAPQLEDLLAGRLDTGLRIAGHLGDHASGMWMSGMVADSRRAITRGRTPTLPSRPEAIGETPQPPRCPCGKRDLWGSGATSGMVARPAHSAAEADEPLRGIDLMFCAVKRRYGCSGCECAFPTDVFRLARLLPEIVEPWRVHVRPGSDPAQRGDGQRPASVHRSGLVLRGDSDALPASISLLDRAAELAARHCRR